MYHWHDCGRWVRRGLQCPYKAKVTKKKKRKPDEREPDPHEIDLIDWWPLLRDVDTKGKDVNEQTVADSAKLLRFPRPDIRSEPQAAMVLGLAVAATVGAY